MVTRWIVGTKGGKKGEDEMVIANIDGGLKNVHGVAEVEAPLLGGAARHDPSGEEGGEIVEVIHHRHHVC